MSSKNQALQDAVSVDNFLNVAATETIPLFEYLSFEFLLGYDVFASSERCGQGLWPRARPCRGRVHERTEVYLSLYLRLIVAITNCERGDNPGREMLRV